MTCAPVVDLVYASEIDAFAHGEYHARHPARSASFARRVDPSAAPGRYHLYAGWASIASHHIAVLRSLLGLTDAVSLSYVDSMRDARGWAFRRRTGPDPVNGFTLLRQAYDATAAGFAGDVRVPLLWDRKTGSVVSDDPATIVADLFDGFRGDVRGLTTGPSVTAEVDCLERAFAGELNAVAALSDPSRRPPFRRALADMDRRLGVEPYLAGDALSDADVRLWVRLARLDAGPNATGVIGPRLDRYPRLWRWAKALYDLPAFAASTDFSRFAAPLADLPPWSPARHDRDLGRADHAVDGGTSWAARGNQRRVLATD